jgi:hypothetical protein
MICPNCGSKLKKTKVEIEDAKARAISYQCVNCDYFTFDPKSAVEVVREIKEKESPLKLRQSIIKISKDRLGVYFSKDLIRSLDLTAGKHVLISVPDKKRIVLKLED